MNTLVSALSAVRCLAVKVFACETCDERDDESKDHLFPPKIGETTSRRIHLTFDDGPHLANTPRLLDVLKGMRCLGNFLFQGKKPRNAASSRSASSANRLGLEVPTCNYQWRHGGNIIWKLIPNGLICYVVANCLRLRN